MEGKEGKEGVDTGKKGVETFRFSINTDLLQTFAGYSLYRTCPLYNIPLVGAEKEKREARYPKSQHPWLLRELT